MKAHDIYIEPQLIARIANGDERSFTELVEKFSGIVYNYIKQHTKDRAMAEEIVQDIFLQVWLIRDTLPEIRNFQSFLYVVTRNYAINAIKKLLREKQHFEEWLSQQPKEEPAVEETDDQLAYYGLIDAAIKELPPQQQKVWVLSRKQGFKHAEIAEQMHISKETVKKYMQYASAHITGYISKRQELLLFLLFEEIIKK